MADVGIEIGFGREIRLAHGEHVGDVAGIARADLDAERVRQHEARDARGRFDGDLGREPAAERNADERRAVEPQLVHEVEIEVGKIVDGRKILRLLGAAEARVRGRDDPRLGRQPVEHRRVGCDADARMEEQDGPPLAALDQLDADPRDRFQPLVQLSPSRTFRPRSMPHPGPCHPRQNAALPRAETGSGADAEN